MIYFSAAAFSGRGSYHHLAIALLELPTTSIRQENQQ